MPKANFKKKNVQSSVSKTSSNESGKGFYLKDNRKSSVNENSSSIKGGVIQRAFIKGKNFKWLDDETKKVYTQTQVRVDNKVRLEGDGETFFIYYRNGKWNRKEVYSQAIDKTVTPFMKSDRTYMGERGAMSQQKGIPPSESHVREDAEKHEDLDDEKGAGLHELMPTNMRDKVAKSGDDVLIAIQSGARTSTALTAFNRKAVSKDVVDTGEREVGLHTGFATKPSKRRGQGPMHDKMRTTLPLILKAKNVKEAINIIMLQHIEVSATGNDILNSVYLTGMTPHLRGVGKLEPVSQPPGPNRLALAHIIHEIRESVKRRTRGLKRTDSSERSRSPSPPRNKIKSDGSGGDTMSYVSPDKEIEEVPRFDGKPGTFGHISNTAAWLTQPQRLGHKESD